MCKWTETLVLHFGPNQSLGERSHLPNQKNPQRKPTVDQTKTKAARGNIENFDLSAWRMVTSSATNDVLTRTQSTPVTFPYLRGWNICYQWTVTRMPVQEENLDNLESSFC